MYIHVHTLMICILMLNIRYFEIHNCDVNSCTGERHHIGLTDSSNVHVQVQCTCPNAVRGHASVYLPFVVIGF